LPIFDFRLPIVFRIGKRQLAIGNRPLAMIFQGVLI
jgi:hypothetical protein